MKRTLRTYDSIRESNHGEFPFMRQLVSVFVGGGSDSNITVDYGDDEFEAECLCVIDGKNCLVTVQGVSGDMVINNIFCDGHHTAEIVGADKCKDVLGDDYDDFVGAIKSTMQ